MCVCEYVVYVGSQAALKKSSKHEKFVPLAVGPAAAATRTELRNFLRFSRNWKKIRRLRLVLHPAKYVHQLALVCTCIVNSGWVGRTSLPFSLPSFTSFAFYRKKVARREQKNPAKNLWPRPLRKKLLSSVIHERFFLKLCSTNLKRLKLWKYD